MTTTSGGVTSGYSAIGNEKIEIKPAKHKMSEITTAKRGRLIKNLENMTD